jgi:hypothetical protein
MGYLRENSLWARTVRPLSKSRNDPYSSQRGKILNIELFYHKCATLSI